MHGHQVPRASTESQQRHSSAHVHEGWLLVGRSSWIALVALTLGIFTASFPVYVTQLHTFCVEGAACSYWHLTSQQAEVLRAVGWSVDGYAAFVVALTLTSLVLYLMLSTLIIWRRPGDRMALLVALLLVSFSTSPATDLVSAATSSLWQVPNKGLISLWQLLLVVVFSLFPSGHFVPPWIRFPLVTGFAGFVLYAWFPKNTLPHALGWFLLLFDQVIVALAQLYRYRRVSRPFERQQTKWVVFGFMGPGMVYIGGTVLAALFPVLSDPASPAGAPYQLALTAISICLLFSFPLSLGVAILRYRLWEIDTLINKALVYGLLTAVLAALYSGLIVGLESLLGLVTGQQAQPVVIVVSTLLIAGLFQPLRRRLQQVVDRRFYRQKYHTEKTLANFCATLTSKLDLEEIREQVVAVVSETMQPASVSLWLCKTEQEHRSPVEASD